MSQSMTIKLSLSVFLALIIFEAAAQRLKTTELQPIHRQGGRYFYGFNRVDGGPYGLQIPLQSLGDEEVSARYNKFKTFRVIAGVISFVPVFYLLSVTTNHTTQTDPKTFWAIWGGSVAAVVLLEVGGRSHLRKGIDRYNELILQPSSHSAGLSLVYRF
jgi:hypothetical protein